MTCMYTRPTRREFLVGAGSLLLLAGCGGGAGGGEENSGETQTITHKYGETKVSGDPKRVLSLGFQEHDAIFALGAKPVAVRYWYGDRDDVIFPWAEDEAGDADDADGADGNHGTEVKAAATSRDGADHGSKVSAVAKSNDAGADDEDEEA